MSTARGPVPVSVSDPVKRDLAQQVLDRLDVEPTLHTRKAFPDVSQPEIKAALDRLASRSMIVYETSEREIAILTDEARTIVAEGSHEFKVWHAVKRNGSLPLKELPVGERRYDEVEPVSDCG